LTLFLAVTIPVDFISEKLRTFYFMETKQNSLNQVVVIMEVFGLKLSKLIHTS
jgi:hypothetical protein